MCIPGWLQSKKALFSSVLGTEDGGQIWRLLRASHVLEGAELGGKPCFAVTLLLLWPSILCAAKGDPVRIFFYCSLSLLATDTHTHIHRKLFSQVPGR